LNDHDLLIRIDEKMTIVLGELKKGEKKITELEKRVESIEGLKHTLLGIVASISFGISIFGVWIMEKLRI